MGLQPLGLENDRDALLYVPVGYQPDRPLPLIVMFHGAGGEARAGLSPFFDRPDNSPIILLATTSRDTTWDIARGGFGPDIALLDQALGMAFDRVSVDPGKIVAAGFSDGASYALSVGLTNGDLFSKVVAFSPGFYAPGQTTGTPKVWIAHGTRDDVLPIDETSRQIVSLLEDAGYDVEYQEFDGGHTVQPEMADEALAWIISETTGWIDAS